MTTESVTDATADEILLKASTAQAIELDVSVPTFAECLERVESFLGRFIAYPSDAALVAHVLWVAHTHAMSNWDSTPRIAFLSPEPGSGKSRALEVTELVVPRPVHAVNTTPAYLFRKVSDEGGLPTILYDEIDTVFGPRAKDNEDIRGLLNAGHRKGAVAGRCVVKGKEVHTEELPAYCAVALAGLDDLPDTIMSRPSSFGCGAGRLTNRSNRSATASIRRKVGTSETGWRTGPPRSRLACGRTCPKESKIATLTCGNRCWPSPMPPVASGPTVPVAPL